MVRSTARSRLPSHAFSKMSARRRPIPGDVHLAVMRNLGLGKDLTEKGLSAKVPISEA